MALCSVSIALLVSFTMVVPAQATLIPVVKLASDNATVQPAGPRAGANGKAFFNMEGSTVGGASFSSFGVADFDFSSLSLGSTATGVVGATLQLTQSNAAFSATGPVSVYLSTQTGVSIDPANTSLNYVTGNNGSAAVDTDLSPLTLLGTGTYTVGANGDQDFYALTFSGGALSTFLSAINGGGTLRLVVTADTDTTAATYAGFSNTTFAGPTLAFFAVVPEPASLALLGLGGLMLLTLWGVRRHCGVFVRHAA